MSDPEKGTGAAAPTPAAAPKVGAAKAPARRIGGPPLPATGAPTGEARTPRLTLASVKGGRKRTADKVLIVGVEGIGKTTFASEAPAPVFLCAEDGTDEIDVQRFPEPRDWQDVLDAVATLTNDPHDFKTLVVDTVDWLEPLCHAHVARRNNWLNKATGEPDVEAAGYGKGWDAVADEWRRLCAALDRLRAERGVEVILLAHATTKTFRNPAGVDYDRFEAKLRRQTYAILKEWAKCVLFAVWEEFVQTKRDGDAKGKGVSTGLRIAQTRRTAAWDAKNRYGLPETIAFDRREYERLREAWFTESAENLRAAIDEAVADLSRDEAFAKSEAPVVRAFVEKHGDDVSALRAALRRLNSRRGDSEE